jgi:hypothetical protein
MIFVIGISYFSGSITKGGKMGTGKQERESAKE